MTNLPTTLILAFMLFSLISTSTLAQSREGDGHLWDCNLEGHVSGRDFFGVIGNIGGEVLLQCTSLKSGETFQQLMQLELSSCFGRPAIIRFGSQLLLLRT